MQKHAQATWRFETCWKTVRVIAQNCSKLALTGQESRWAPAARNGFLPPVPALGAAKPHFACTNIQNHGKSNLSLKAWQLKWLLNGYYVTTRNSMINQIQHTKIQLIRIYPRIPIFCHWFNIVNPLHLCFSMRSTNWAPARVPASCSSPHDDDAMSHGPSPHRPWHRVLQKKKWSRETDQGIFGFEILPGFVQLFCQNYLGN